MVTNRTAQFGHTNGIHESKKKPDERCCKVVMIRVVNAKALPLDHRDMRQAWEERGVKVFGLPWTRNNASRKDISNLVLLVGHKIQDYPDVNPTIRFFVVIELCTINREHYHSVVVADKPIFYGIEIV